MNANSWRRAALAASAWVAGCVMAGCTDPPSPIARSPEATPPSGTASVPAVDVKPKQRFTGELTVDALVALTDEGAPLASEAALTLLAARQTAALDCLTGGAAVSGRVWFVGRISTSGVLEDQKRMEGDLPDAADRCIEKAIDNLAFEPLATPRAISFTFHFRP